MTGTQITTAAVHDALPGTVGGTRGAKLGPGLGTSHSDVAPRVLRHGSHIPADPRTPVGRHVALAAALPKLGTHRQAAARRPRPGIPTSFPRHAQRTASSPQRSTG